jgi:hypothetical protein
MERQKMHQMLKLPKNWKGKLEYFYKLKIGSRSKNLDSLFSKNISCFSTYFSSMPIPVGLQKFNKDDAEQKRGKLKSYKRKKVLNCGYVR